MSHHSELHHIAADMHENASKNTVTPVDGTIQRFALLELGFIDHLEGSEVTL